MRKQEVISYFCHSLLIADQCELYNPILSRPTFHSDLVFPCVGMGEDLHVDGHLTYCVLHAGPWIRGGGGGGGEGSQREGVSQDPEEWIWDRCHCSPVVP